MNRLPFSARALRWALIVCMTSVWTGVLPALAVAQAQAAQGNLADEKSLALLTRFVEVGKAELKRVEALAPDVSAQAAALDHDPAKVFAFVRDRVQSEPYAGVLRGGRGALAARSGNSADKALLLKSMLETGGTAARLVQGKLPAGQASALVEQFLAADPLAGPLGEMDKTADDNAALAEFCKKTGLDEKKMAAVAADTNKQSADTLAAVQKQTDEALAHLQDQIKQAKIAVGQSAAQWREQLNARVAAHTWVQYQDDAGKWIDLDPSFADAQPGQAKADGGAEAKADSLGRHTVNLTLTYSTTSGMGSSKGPKQEQLLVVPLAVDEAMFRPTSFTILPADSLPPVDQLVAMDPAERAKLIGNISKFQALIRSGERTYASKVFDLKGRTYDVSTDGRVKGASELGARAGDVFGGAMGGGAMGGEAPGADTAFDSLSMNVSFDVPAGQEAIPPQNRVLLTAADLKADHAVSPLVDWEMLIQPQLISSEFGVAGQLRNLIATVEPAIAAIRKSQAGETVSLEGLLNNVPAHYPHLLMNWSLFRESGLARALRASPDAAVLWDAPQVIVAERRFCLNKKTGHMCDRSRIDIMHNGLALVPRKAGADAAAATLAMRQGVYDTVAERVILEKAAPEGIATSAAAALETARTADAKLAAYAAADVGSSPLSAFDQNYVKTCEPDRHLLVPTAANGAPAAWWSLDPRTGSVVGRGTGGYGASMVENSMMQQLAGGAMCFIAAGKDLKAVAAGDQHNIHVSIFTFLACAIATGTGALGAMKGGLGPLGQGICFYINLAITGGITIFK